MGRKGRKTARYCCVCHIFLYVSSWRLHPIVCCHNTRRCAAVEYRRCGVRRAVEQDAELESLFSGLSLQGKGRKKDCLAALDKLLEEQHDAEGSSRTKFIKDHIVKRGYCLADCKPYGRGLKNMLLTHPEMRVGKQDAKQYHYVRKCLIEL